MPKIDSNQPLAGTSLEQQIQGDENKLETKPIGKGQIAATQGGDEISTLQNLTRNPGEAGVLGGFQSGSRDAFGQGSVPPQGYWRRPGVSDRLRQGQSGRSQQGYRWRAQADATLEIHERLSEVGGHPVYIELGPGDPFPGQGPEIYLCPRADAEPHGQADAGAMMDSFDADAYAKGMNAAITTVSLPVTLQGFASGAGVAGALVPANLSAGIHATSTGLVHGLSHSTAGTGGNIGWGNWGHEVAVGQTKAAILDPHELRQARNPVQMPTIPVKMRSGAVKDVKLTDKHTAMALLIYLGRSVDHAKVTRGDAREISRRNLRLELFHAGDDEHLQLAEKTGKVETDSAGRKENERLMEALFYEDTESREAILARARPMKKLFAAAGLLETPSFRERFQPASNGPG